MTVCVLELTFFILPEHVLFSQRGRGCAGKPGICKIFTRKTFRVQVCAKSTVHHTPDGGCVFNDISRNSRKAGHEGCVSSLSALHVSRRDILFRDYLASTYPERSRILLSAHHRLISDRTNWSGPTCDIGRRTWLTGRASLDVRHATQLRRGVPHVLLAARKAFVLCDAAFGRPRVCFTSAKRVSETRLWFQLNTTSRPRKRKPTAAFSVLKPLCESNHAPLLKSIHSRLKSVLRDRVVSLIQLEIKSICG